MALGYRPVDRDQQFLLPPDMREWLPKPHLVWFVIEMVDQLDTSAFHERSVLGGVGRAGFDPDMLLALLVYGYAGGVRSARLNHPGFGGGIDPTKGWSHVSTAEVSA